MKKHWGDSLLKHIDVERKAHTTTVTTKYHQQVVEETQNSMTIKPTFGGSLLWKDNLLILKS